MTTKIKLIEGLHLTARERQMIVHASNNRDRNGVYSARMSVSVDWSVVPHVATFRKNERDDFNRPVVRDSRVKFTVAE